MVGSKSLSLESFLVCILMWGAASLLEAEENKIIPTLNFDSRYGPINGSPLGKSLFLRYCLPDLKPLQVGVCKSKRNEKNVLKMHFQYFLGTSEPPRLEAAARFDFPFSYKQNYIGKTPYEVNYSDPHPKKTAINKASYLISRNKYGGLLPYEFVGPSIIIWIPENYLADKTRLGNPLVFFCSGTRCTLDVDMGNGWIVTSEFDESALSDWKSLYKNIYKSVDIVMGR